MVMYPPFFARHCVEDPEDGCAGGSQLRHFEEKPNGGVSKQTR
jgi:hypothetical protein